MTMDNTLKEMFSEAMWIAHSLFERGKTSGTTANLSFRFGDNVWITRSGSCFGTLGSDDFVCVERSGHVVNDGNPSKELPLHLALYDACEATQAVIHIHAPYSTLWSCLPHEDARDVIPHYTPYLQMKLGAVVDVPYAPPGTEELFSIMRNTIGEEKGYLLCNHGPIVAGRTLMHAFECIEELEQGAWLAWNAYLSSQPFRSI